MDNDLVSVYNQLISLIESFFNGDLFAHKKIETGKWTLEQCNKFNHKNLDLLKSGYMSSFASAHLKARFLEMTAEKLICKIQLDSKFNLDSAKTLIKEYLS